MLPRLLRFGRITRWSSLSPSLYQIFEQNVITGHKITYPFLKNLSTISSGSNPKIPKIFDETELNNETLDQLEYFHSLAMSDERWKIKNSELQNCLKKPSTNINNTSFLHEKLIPLLEKFHIIYPYRDPLSLMRTTYEQSSKRQILEAFKIKFDDTDGNMFLLLIHAWLVHRRLVELVKKIKFKLTLVISDIIRELIYIFQKLGSLNTLYWEKVWDTYRAFLLAHQIRDTMFSRYLQEMQQVAIDFCIKLDYAFDSDSDYWSGLLRYLLWKNMYEQKGVPLTDETLGELLVYILKMFQFLRLLPSEVFSTGNFRWYTILDFITSSHIKLMSYHTIH